MTDWPSYSATRIPALGLTKTGRIWRFVDVTDAPRASGPACVGPQYRTKMEALADLNRYAADSGWSND